MVQIPSAHKGSRDGLIPHETDHLRATNYTRNGANGDLPCCQPPTWAEKGKPVTETHADRYKWLNGCRNCVQISPELIRGTRAARQLWLRGLFGPQWHWPKRHLIEFCLNDLITWLQPSFWRLISLSRARREMLTHGQKAKTVGERLFWTGIKKIE